MDQETAVMRSACAENGNIKAVAEFYDSIDQQVIVNGFKQQDNALYREGRGQSEQPKLSSCHVILQHAFFRKCEAGHGKSLLFANLAESFQKRVFFFFIKMSAKYGDHVHCIRHVITLINPEKTKGFVSQQNPLQNPRPLYHGGAGNARGFLASMQ